MSNVKNELRVGLMFIIGIVLTVMLMAYLSHWGASRNVYNFIIQYSQAQGLIAGATVRVSGVDVGKVKGVGLDPVSNRANVYVSVNNGVKLYKSYFFSINSAGLVGERFIEISKTDKPGTLVTEGDIVDGSTPADLNDIMANANKLVTNLNQTATSLNNMLGDEGMLNDMRGTMSSMHQTMVASAEFTEALNGFVRRNSSSLDAIIYSMTATASDIQRLSADITPKLMNSKTFHNLELASENAAILTQRMVSISDAVDKTVNDPELANALHASVRSMQASTASLDAILADARQASASLPRIAANFERASNDIPAITGPFRDIAPETAENIRLISSNLRDTGSSIGKIANSLTGVGGGGKDGIQVTPEIRLMGLNDNSHISRSDLYVDLRGKKDFYRVGISDVGNANMFNLQFGQNTSPNLAIRYGLVDGKIGGGVDYRFNGDAKISADLFDPNRTRMNALVDYRLRPLGNDWSLSSGFYNIFDHPTFSLGLTYRPHSDMKVNTNGDVSEDILPPR